MTGRSFLDVLLSTKSDLVDPSRNFIVSMKERHDIGREGDVGYPIRTLRTNDFLYIHNFKPERPPAVSRKQATARSTTHPRRAL